MIDINNRLMFWKNDIAEIVGKSNRTIDRWIQEGKFPKPSSYQGSKPYWTRKQILELVGE